MKKHTFYILLFTLLLNCENKNGFEQYNPKEFIDEFFKINSERIFIDEIERVKINYFHESNFLVYTFKSERKLNQEGDLFLQLFPKDVNNLTLKRKQYGCVNLSINKKEIFKFSNTRHLLIKKLQFPFNIKSIKTGSFKNKNKKWSVNYRDSLTLKNYRLNASKISNEDTLVFDKFKFNNSSIALGDIGVKIFSIKEKKIVAYYNPNRLSLTTYFGDIDQSNSFSNYNIIITLKNDSVITKNIDLNKIHSTENFGLSFVKFKDSLDIKTISLSQKDWNKTLNTYSLIHYTHVKRLSNIIHNKSSSDNRVYNLIEYFFTNTLKNLYSKNNKIDIYTNGARNNIYIKTALEKSNNNLYAKIYYNKNKFNNNFSYEELPFSKRKRLSLKNNEQKYVIYKLKIPDEASKIEFGFKNNNNFNIFYVFKK